jgi:tetratricopeptide (TPR) repeat protein
MRSLIRLATGALFVMSMLLAPSVHADANTAKAKQSYDEGVTNYNLGHYDEALKDFETSYRLRHDAAFLFNIAQCQRQLQHYQDAERSYRAYLRESPDLPTSTREQVQKLIADMDHAVAEEKEHAKQPPTGTQPPAEGQPGVALQQSTTPSPAQTQATSDLQAQAAPPPAREKPVYKRGWFWGVMAGVVVAAGVGVGLGVGLSSSKSNPFPSVQF